MQFFLRKWKFVIKTVVLILKLLVFILIVIDLIGKAIIVLYLQVIVKSPMVFIVIVLTENNWVNTGDLLLRTVNLCVRMNVDTVVFVVKFLIFLCNCRKPIFFKRMWFVDLHLKKCLCNLYCGVFLIETLINTILLLRLKLQNQFRILALLQFMGRHVDRKFIVHLIKGFYKEKTFIILCVIVLSVSVLSIFYKKLNDGVFMIWIRHTTNGL